MEWSWSTWAISVVAVIISGAIAWAEGNWTRRPEVGIGFGNHGGMWSDVILLPFANAVIVPHLTIGWWIVVALVASMAASAWVHWYWYRPDSTRVNHMWPTHARRSWWRDLSWSGWVHVLYVIGELALLAGYVMHPMPPEVVILVAAVFTVHVPIGLLQPRYFLTGHIATIAEQPLLAPLLLMLWAVASVKIMGLDSLTG